jgi:hypothetical protein
VPGSRSPKPVARKAGARGHWDDEGPPDGVETPRSASSAPPAAHSQARPDASQPSRPAEPTAAPAAECPGCRSVLQLTQEQVGRWVECPKCGTGFAASSPAASATAESSPSPDERLSGRRQRRCVLSPGALLLAVFVFPLPWVEVSCDTTVRNSGSKTFAKQSGLQAAYGGYSLNPALVGLKEEIEREISSVKGKKPPADRGQHLEPIGSPLMLAYPFALLGGIFFGLVLPANHSRFVTVGIFSVLAVALLIIQIGVGFPIELAAPKVAGSAESDVQLRNLLLVASLAFDTRYTAWFWIAVCATLAAPLLLLLERAWVNGTIPWPRRQ